MVAASRLQEDAAQPGYEEAHVRTRPSDSQVVPGGRMSSCLWVCVSECVCHAVDCMLCYSCVSQAADGL